MKNNKISKFNTIFKRVFDLVFSFLGAILISPIIILLFFVATFDTKENGFFLQNRVGRKGNIFKIIKIRTMKSNKRTFKAIATSTDPIVTKVGKVLRKYKLDELPQIYNVFIGQMSFVGPRPNFAEKYNRLPKDEKEILCSIRPGITGPASIKYKNEEDLDKANIFKDKVRINIEYIKNYNIFDDIRYIYKTLLQ